MTLVARIETIGGNIVDLLNPSPDHIKLSEISLVLSRMPRFGCQSPVDPQYTVGQHSIYCTNLLDSYRQRLSPERDALFDGFLMKVVGTTVGRIGTTQLTHALMHDTAEAYLTDIPTPIKRIPGIYEAYMQVEAGVMSAIYTKMGIPALTKWDEALVKMVDAYSLCVEAFHFMPSKGAEWNLPFSPIPEDRDMVFVPNGYRQTDSEFQKLYYSLQMD